MTGRIKHMQSFSRTNTHARTLPHAHTQNINTCTGESALTCPYLPNVPLTPFIDTSTIITTHSLPSLTRHSALSFFPFFFFNTTVSDRLLNGGKCLRHVYSSVMTHPYLAVHIFSREQSSTWSHRLLIVGDH